MPLTFSPSATHPGSFCLSINSSSLRRFSDERPIGPCHWYRKAWVACKSCRKRRSLRHESLQARPRHQGKPKLDSIGFRCPSCWMHLWVATILRLSASNNDLNFRRGRTDLCPMDVALPRNTKEMRVRPLVQISREGSFVNTELLTLFVPEVSRRSVISKFTA